MTDQNRVCGNGSVGIINRDLIGRILMIEYENYPDGFSPPTGHCDGDCYQAACHRIFKEQTGLSIMGAPRPLRLYKPIKNNLCSRGGLHHDWQVFQVDCALGMGKFRDIINGVRWIGWVEISVIRELTDRTEEYLRRLKFAEQGDCDGLSEEIKSHVKKVWRVSPGLNIAWLEIFKELGIL